MDERDLQMQQLRADLAKAENKIHCLESQIEGWVEANDRLLKDNINLASKFIDCRNELCFVCGRKEMEHDGYCNSCRWRAKDE